MYFFFLFFFVTSFYFYYIILFPYGLICINVHTFYLYARSWKFSSCFGLLTKTLICVIIRLLLNDLYILLETSRVASLWEVFETFSLFSKGLRFKINMLTPQLRHQSEKTGNSFVRFSDNLNMTFPCLFEKTLHFRNKSQRKTLVNCILYSIMTVVTNSLRIRGQTNFRNLIISRF